MNLCKIVKGKEDDGLAKGRLGTKMSFEGDTKPWNKSSKGDPALVPSSNLFFALPP